MEVVRTETVDGVTTVYTEEEPRHLFSIGGYESDIMNKRFVGTRQDWENWRRDPEAYYERKRKKREEMVRNRQEMWIGRTANLESGIAKRQREAKISVLDYYTDPARALERITDYRHPLFDSETREWLSKQADLHGGCLPRSPQPKRRRNIDWDGALAVLVVMLMITLLLGATVFA